MLKVHTAKTAAFFIAASGLALTPPASMAIEDCGTSVTECRMKQQIKDLQRQVDELKAKTDAFSVSSGGNVGIGTTNPKAKLHIHKKNGNSLLLTREHGAPYMRFRDGAQVAEIQFYGQGDYQNNPMLFIQNGAGGKLGRVSINANVGIGTRSPQYKLDVNGTIRGYNLTPSDQRFKQNIHPLDNAITKLQELRGVSFEWKNSQAQEAGTQIGLIAQEVEGVLPELVSTDSDGYKSIAYGQLSAVLIEAVKEQQQIIEQKSATIAELQLSLQKQQEQHAAQQAAQAEKIASLEAMMQEMARQVAALKRETVAQPVVQTHLSVSP